MEEDVIFSDPPRSVEGADLDYLPYNYLPAALSAIANDSSAQSRIVMTFPKPQSDAARLDYGAVFTAIHPELLRHPGETAAFLRGLQDEIGADFTPQPWFLGPPTELRHDTENKILTLDRTPFELEAETDFTAAVVVIDAGIAFWNRRFQGPTGPRFQAIRFLDFDLPVGTPPSKTRLTYEEIKDICKYAEAGGDADRRIVACLRERFPGSFYGSAAAEDVDGLWHGSAMADLAAGDSGKKVALFGLELPTKMVEDYSGDTLANSMLTVLEAALMMTASIQSVPVIILLPYAFTGGPQDGTHPAAEIIRTFLAVPGRAGLNIVVSAGNLLQGRLRARLPGTTNAGARMNLDWWVPPDDFSPNTVEAIIENVSSMNGRASLDVKAPTNIDAAVSGLTEGQSRDLIRRGAVIGSIVRFKNIGTTARLRLSLHPTGYAGKPVTAPHGRWELSTPSTQHADLWVLRDDRDSLFDREYPHRQSHFAHQLYRPTNKVGAPRLDDDPGSPVMRSGTLSPLGTAVGVSVVQANEKLGIGLPQQAEYSGRPDVGAVLTLQQALVDDGYPERGEPASANGTDRRMRVSGTSSAAALYVRSIT
ncbi:MAG: hypothetical protein ACK47C_05800 [Paracoccaceae bacterium]